MPKPARKSLATFSPASVATADGGKVEQSGALPLEQTGPTGRMKYPSVTVYLRPEEIRTLKLLAIETDGKVSDICATAVREWMARNGHARTGKLDARA